jgi:predicted glycoside hydrolase/deacetylase ChbG (UPF0249 family)
MTPVFLAQAEREYRAQFEKMRATGRTPTRVDFEKHHAWQRPLYALAARLAEEYGARGIRNLAEPVWLSLREMGLPAKKRARSVWMSCVLRTGFALGGGRVRTPLFRPDYFFGQLHIGEITESVLLRLLAALPAGTSELMTHPGLPDAEAAEGEENAESGMSASWITAHREAELRALTSPAVRRAVESSGVELKAL